MYSLLASNAGVLRAENAFDQIHIYPTDVASRRARGTRNVNLKRRRKRPVTGPARWKRDGREIVLLVRFERRRVVLSTSYFVGRTKRRRRRGRSAISRHLRSRRDVAFVATITASKGRRANVFRPIRNWATRTTGGREWAPYFRAMESTYAPLRGHINTETVWFSKRVRRRSYIYIFRVRKRFHFFPGSKTVR